MDTLTPVPPAEHHAPQVIAPDTHLIRQLPGDGSGPVAVYVNSMVIAGPEPIVVDTGTFVNREQWFEDVFSIVDPEDIAYVFLSHDDHDHVGNLVPLLRAAPQATLITSWFTMERLAGDLSVPLERMRWLNDGDTFDAAGRTLAVVRPPIYDSPATRGLFDPATGVYWAVDAYATTVPHAVDDVADLDPDFWDDQFLALNRMGSPWATIVDPTLFAREAARVGALGIRTIASAHSPVITDANVGSAQQKLLRITTGPETALPTQVDLEAMLAALDPALAGAGGSPVGVAER